MFGSLFIKECKQILKSLVFYIYVVAMVLFLLSQLSDETWSKALAEPKPGQEYYGSKESHEESAVMSGVLENLVREYNMGTYATYPYGFYKGVTLNEQENEDIKKIIEQLTGKTIEQLVQEEIAHYEKYDTEDDSSAWEAYATYTVQAAEDVTYEEFQLAMKRVSQMIGNGSGYEGDLLEKGAEALMTYEDALVEYQALCELDRGTGAYMRLFCDYAGIVLLILPIFLGATRVLRDKRAQAVQVIYSRSISSAKLVGSRYLANVVMTFVPVVIVAFLIQSPYAYQMESLGVKPDYFAFLKYSVVWLLPAIMITLALSFLLTELLESVLAVILQVFVGYGALISADTLAGNFGLKMEVRWNTLGATLEFWEQRQDLFLNRGFYAVLSVLLVLVTFWIYEKKRKEGIKLHGKIFKNRH